MHIESETEYEEYLRTKTLSELLQISDSINRSLYRRRYELVKDRIQYLQNLPKKSSAPLTSEVISSHRERLGAFDILVLLISEFLVGAQGFLALFGTLWARGESKTAWTLFEQFIPILFLLFCALSIYSLFGKFGKTTKYILIGISLYFIAPYWLGGDILLPLVAPTILIFAVHWVNSK